jgi:hypothetical protein
MLLFCLFGSKPKSTLSLQLPLLFNHLSVACQLTAGLRAMRMTDAN